MDSKEEIYCPLCGKKIHKFLLSNVNANVDVCLDGCGGIFFDGRELKKISDNEIDSSKLVSEDGYLSVTEQRLNAKHNLLAYLENRDGSDRYTAFIKNLETGELLHDEIPNVYLYSSIEWSKCSNYIFYITVDELQRPYQLWRHHIGSDVASDELLL